MSEEIEEEDATARMVVAEYAQSRGIPVEEAMKKFLPIVKQRSRNPLVARTLEACHVLSEIKEAGEGADPVTKELLATLAGNVVGGSLGRTPATEEDDLRDVERYIKRIKALDVAFPQSTKDPIRNSVNEALGEYLAGLIKGNIKKEGDPRLEKLEEQIEKLVEGKEKEELKAVLDKMSELVDPLQERLVALEEGKGGEKRPGEKELLDMVSEAKDKAERFLTGAGYKVQLDRGLTEEEVKKLIEHKQIEYFESLPPEELKERLEKAGYKILGGPLTYEQVEKLVEEARHKAQEEVLDDKRIAAVENIVRDSVAQIVSMFKPAVSLWMEHSVGSRGKGEEKAESGSGRERETSTSESKTSEAESKSQFERYRRGKGGEEGS